MEQQQMHAPQLWEESTKRWLQVESVPPTHTVGMADIGRLCGVGRGGVLGIRSGGSRGTGMGRRHRVPAQEGAVPGPGLLQCVQGVPQGAGPGAQGAQVHGQGHPAGAGSLRGGIATAESPETGRLACSPEQHVASSAVMCRALQGQAAALPNAPAAQF